MFTHGKILLQSKFQLEIKSFKFSVTVYKYNKKKKKKNLIKFRLIRQVKLEKSKLKQLLIQIIMII